MPKKPHLPWVRYLPAAIIFGVGVGLSLVAFLLVWDWEDKRRDYEFNRRTDIIVNRLQQHLDADIEVIRNIGDFFEAADTTQRSSFERFLRRPLSNHPSIGFIAWVERVSDVERYAYEAKLQIEAPVDFAILENRDWDRAVIAEDRPLYYPISYINPLDKNRKALGLDLASDPDYKWALDLARETGEMVITGLVKWPFGEDKQQGLLVVQPVYNLSNPEQTLQQGVNVPPRTPDRLQGFVVGLLEVGNILEISLASRGVNNLNLYLCDETPGNKEAIASQSGENRLLAIFESTEILLSPSKQQAFKMEMPSQCPMTELETHRAWGDLLLGAEQISRRREIEVGNREWWLYVVPTADYQSSRKHWRSWAVLIMGLLWTHIPVTYLLTSLSRTAQIEALAKERSLQAEQLRHAFKQLETEQAKSERLLLNVLPKAIAERLKQEQQTIADSFPEVTVLFADIVGFTKLASRISPPELVEVLNTIFTAFDRLAAKHRLEKIKTIGDAYMVVGGLPVHRDDHAEAIAEMALDMQEEINRFSEGHTESFSMRIGIHTGPVIAGVIGTNKFIYDLWGDTVNVASRMESHGVPGRIQVSGTTYELLRHKYCFHKRGPIHIKSKGEMIVYLLYGRNKGGEGQPPLALPSEEISAFYQGRPVESKKEGI